jgi:poly(A) polymerase
MIGDPLQRYQEDPVRLLRAIRFAAKLDFKIEKKTAAAIQEVAYLLHQTAPPRLFEEMIKLFLKGHAQKTYELLKYYDVFKEIFPVSAYVVAHPNHYPVDNFFRIAMKNSDIRIAEYKSLNPAFILAVFLWYPFLIERERAKQHGLSDIVATGEAIHRTLREQQHIVQITKRFAAILEEIWHFQFRLERRYWRAVPKLLAHPRFRAAYDFLLLRAEAGEPVKPIAEWWTKFYHAEDNTRAEMIKKIKTAGTLPPKKPEEINSTRK